MMTKDSKDEDVRRIRELIYGLAEANVREVETEIPYFSTSTNNGKLKIRVVFKS